MNDKTVGVEILTKTHEATYETYHWHCPGCGCKREANRPPEDNEGDLLCHECWKAWDAQRFDAHFAPVMGARVTGVNKPSEAFDREDVQRLELTDESGQVWLVTSDSIIYVYRDNRTPGVQRGDDEH